MSSLRIDRSSQDRSRWDQYRIMINAALERVGLPLLDDPAWSDCGDGVEFSGSGHECRAVSVALEGLGLSIHEATGPLREAP